ncbi:MAG: DUF1566 domain-containing protein [Elusimicrobia bacterium]|nr:DUF1566 domain-containing protein [Elusimicrobiota bacterium]
MAKINKTAILSVILLAGAAGFSRGADVSMHALGRKSGLPDTGQTLCYDGTGIVIVCPASGGALAQDGSYTSNASSPSYTLNGISPNQTTTDNRTGLMWATDGLGAGCMNGGVDVSTMALAYCEGLTFAGYTDWRLPNVRELMSIVDYGISNPAINATYFPNTQTANYYWSSTTALSDTSYAWGVYFNYGGIYSNGKNVNNSVRCVRAGP